MPLASSQTEKGWCAGRRKRLTAEVETQKAQLLATQQALAALQVDISMQRAEAILDDTGRELYAYPGNRMRGGRDSDPWGLLA